MKIADLSPSELDRRLRGGGVTLRFGPFVIRLRAPIAGLAASLHGLYHDYPLVDERVIPDIHARLAYPPGVRRFLKPKVYFYCDHQRPFRPMPPALAVPLLEWGLNWAIANRAHQWFMFHAACIEMNGHAAILPGPPGSGKSTLTAALVWRGWRLMTDETTLIDPATGLITAAGRPVSLKNQSIDILRGFEPRAFITAASPDTHKGVLAHMRLPPESLARLWETALPRWVIFPRYEPGAPAVFEPIARSKALMRLIPNTFNYSILGERGFETLSAIVERSEAMEFRYGDLNEAIAAFAVLASRAGSAPSVTRPIALDSPEESPAPPVSKTTQSTRQSDPAELLLTALREPGPVPTLDECQWDLLVRTARKAGVLARLGCRWRGSPRWETIPPRARVQLESAMTIASKHAAVVRWEINRIARALAPLEIPVLLLKGGAYVAAGLPAAVGRLVNDVDIMVPRAMLDRVEQALKEQGWEGVEADAYDEAYYRRWMHELPPMRHRNRETYLDVHHNILPLTGRLKPDAEKLFAAAVPLTQSDQSSTTTCWGASCLHTLSPADMVLHSAAHLFQDGELEGGLRDLTDLDGLLRHFTAKDAAFPEALVDRAGELGLGRPLVYVLRYTQRMLGTPISESVMRRAAVRGPSAPVRGLMDALVVRGLTPAAPDYKPFSAVLASQMLYIRAHWLRMPPLLLASHLVKKAWRRIVEPDDQQDETQ